MTKRVAPSHGGKGIGCPARSLLAVGLGVCVIVGFMLAMPSLMRHRGPITPTPVTTTTTTLPDALADEEPPSIPSPMPAPTVGVTPLPLPIPTPAPPGPAESPPRPLPTPTPPRVTPGQGRPPPGSAGTGRHETYEGELERARREEERDRRMMERVSAEEIVDLRRAFVLSRYPNLDAPHEVVVEQPFAAVVSLTRDAPSEGTVVVQGETTSEGGLILRLPADQVAWTLDVVLSAPGFLIQDGANMQAIELPRNGDSTSALFRLRARAPARDREARSIEATLWRDGAYVARIARSVVVVPASTQEARGLVGVVKESPSRPDRPSPATIDMGLAYPDLTLFLRSNPEEASQVLLTIASPHLQPSVSEFKVPSDLKPWLEAQYAFFGGASPRGAAPLDEGSAARRDLVLARLRGFGDELYRRFAPSAFKQAFWQLKGLRGERFRSIQIFTDDPSLPWELMRPSREDGPAEREFLGIDFQIARWHVGPPPQLERPPQLLSVREVAVIAPQYKGAELLPSQGVERERLARLFGYRAVPGQLGTLKSLAASPPQGIVHFIGHGVVRASAEGIPEYVVRLEDADLDLMAWRGMTGRSTRAHPLFFFNACDLGGAGRVAGFVEGWAPAVLDAGASGYIGGLWPLGDRGAAMFARRFYDELDPAFRGDPVVVSEVLRRARRSFYETADPTFLAYVFYGDPLLALRAGAQP